METEDRSLEIILVQALLNSPEFNSRLESLISEKIELLFKVKSTNMAKKFYTTEELAILLKIKKQTIYSHVRRGLLKPVRAGLSMRFSQQAIDEYLLS